MAKHTSKPISGYKISPGLTCQKCESHDETIRLAGYPFIYSLVYTFRGEFKGRWCHRHRTLFMLLAAVITSTVGFLGFPGIYLASITLIRLAQGGNLHKANNTKHLRSMAEAKKQQGDLQGAQQCLEASFQFVDDLWGQQELSEYYSVQTRENSSRQRNTLGRLTGTLALLICGSLLGLLVGLTSYFLDDSLFDQVLWQFSGLQPFWSWLPLFGAGFPAVLCVRQFQENLFNRWQIQKHILARALAFLCALVMSLGIVEGRALGNFLDIIIHGATLPPLGELLIAIGAVATRGGIFEIYRISSTPNSSLVVRAIFLVVLAAYIVYSLQVCASTHITWQSRLLKIRRQANYSVRSNHIVAWASLAAGAAGLALTVFIFPQKSIVDFLQARDHFRIGLDLEYQEEYEAAILEFQEAVRLDPYMVESYEELGWSNDELGNTQVAIDQFTKGIAANPHRADTHFYLGNVYYYDNQDEKASQEFEKVIQIDPTYTQAYLGLGWSTYYLGELDQAESYFKKALELDPNLSDAYIGLGYIFDDKGDTEHQIEVYLQATQAPDASSDSFTLLGMAYFEKYEYELAIDNLETATHYDDALPISQIYLGLSYLRVGKVEQAAALAQQMIEIDGEWIAPHALLASAYIEMNLMDDAEDELQKARSIKDKTDFERFMILSALYDAGWFSDAEEEALAGIENGFARAAFYLELASALSGQERYTEAHQACGQAEALGADSFDVLLQRGSTYMDEEKYDNSLTILLEAEKQDANDPTVHSLLSIVHYELGDYSLSVTEAQKAVQINRYSLNGYMNLAYANLALNNYTEVIQAAIRASELSPHYDLPYYLQGAGYLGNFEEHSAYTAFQKFIELYRGDPSLQELRDNVEEIIGELEKNLEQTG